jgi:hypothetical protein
MMLLLLALLQAAPSTSGAPAPTPIAPPVGHAPTVTVTGPEPEPTAAEAEKTAEQVQEMYNVSCAAREFGAYDDMCDALNKQVKEAKATAQRLAKKEKAAAH